MIGVCLHIVLALWHLTLMQWLWPLKPCSTCCTLSVGATVSTNGRCMLAHCFGPVASNLDAGTLTFETVFHMLHPHCWSYSLNIVCVHSPWGVSMHWHIFWPCDLWPWSCDFDLEILVEPPLSRVLKQQSPKLVCTLWQGGIPIAWWPWNERGEWVSSLTGLHGQRLFTTWPSMNSGFWDEDVQSLKFGNCHTRGVHWLIFGTLWPLILALRPWPWNFCCTSCAYDIGAACSCPLAFIWVMIPLALDLWPWPWNSCGTPVS